MELLEFKKKMFELLNVNKTDDIPRVLFSKIMSHDTKLYDDYAEIIDNTKDWLQSLWQYYQADRSNLKQDYTPKSLAKLVSKICGNADSVYDCCGGSGALTVECFENMKPKTLFIEELDGKVIPFLLFNLCFHNANAIVVHGNALTKEYFEAYRIEPSDKYSKCHECVDMPRLEKYSVAVSNPPFNIKWEPPSPLEAAASGTYPVTLPSSNANYAFVLNCFSASERSVLILPCGVMSQSNEYDIRKYLVDNDFLEAVIVLPNHMFECTDISTCILVLNKNKQKKETTVFVDLRKSGTIESRAQNGQYGGASHTKRTYKKDFNILSDEIIAKTVLAIKKCENEPEFSKSASTDEIAQQDYILIPSRYVELKSNEEDSRSYKDIVENLNVLNRQKNSCKLIINETLAKECGFDIDLYKKNKEKSKELSESVQRICGEKLITDDYIQFSKNKNEFCFKSNDKEILSHLFVFFLNAWKQDIHLINQLENTYLEELRDKMLPDLMSGKVVIE